CRSARRADEATYVPGNYLPARRRNRLRCLVRRLARHALAGPTRRSYLGGDYHCRWASGWLGYSAGSGTGTSIQSASIVMVLPAKRVPPSLRIVSAAALHASSLSNI